MVKCKVLVRLTVQVEQTSYNDYDRPLRDMFRSVADQATGKVQRVIAGLDDVRIVGSPMVEGILTAEVDVPVEAPARAEVPA